METSKDILIHKINELREERDMLAYENKALAVFLEELGYEPDSIIAHHREG